MTAGMFTFTDRAVPLIQIGIGDNRVEDATTIWDAARWDAADAVWSGADPTWRDVTCDTISYECEYGRSEIIGRFEAGTATVVVDNASGWADPSHDITPGELSMRPGRPIRLGVDHVELGPVWLFHGYIDALTPRYDPVEQDLVAIDCVDALGDVGRAKMVRLPAPVGGGETATVRINRLLDLVPWPNSLRDIDTSSDALLESDLGGQLADMLGQAADSVGGAIFGDRTGTICFRNRDWQTWDPAAPPDAVIANSGGTSDVVFGASDVVFGASDVVFGSGATGDAVCPSRWERPFERAEITTRVILGRDADTAIQIDDREGQARYGIEPFERTNLITQSDGVIGELAARILVVRDESTAPSVRSVTLNAATADNALDLMATADPYLPTRVQCRLSLARGVVFDEMHFVTAVRHRVEPDDWQTDLNLGRAEPFATVGGFWETARWDAGVWAPSPAAFAALDLERVAV